MIALRLQLDIVKDPRCSRATACFVPLSPVRGTVVLSVSHRMPTILCPKMIAENPTENEVGKQGYQTNWRLYNVE